MPVVLFPFVNMDDGGVFEVLFFHPTSAEWESEF